MKCLMSNLILFLPVYSVENRNYSRFFFELDKNGHLKILKINLLSLENFETLNFLLRILLAEITFKDARADHLQ